MLYILVVASVYQIRNIISGSLYVGSALNWKQRRRRHFNDLRKGVHHSPYLQRSFNKYGLVAFEFSVIEQDLKESILLNREQYWMDLLKPSYNNSKVAGNALGVKHRPESVLKNKIRNTGFGNGNARLKETDLKEILDLATVMTTKNIAAKFNVHRSSVERLIKRYGVTKPKIYSSEGREAISVLAKKRRNRAKSVVQYSLNKDFIAVFPSANEASKITGVSICQIIESCKNRVKNPKRFLFSFARQA